MKIKTSESTGAALDWAVMSVIYPGIDTGQFWFDFVKANPHSTRWDLAGPIIEREGIQLEPIGAEDFDYDFEEEEEGEEGEQVSGWSAFHMIKGGRHHSDESLLVAAMRCYVASKLGDEVEVPEELTRKEQG
jgi:hypothetical protein